MISVAIVDNNAVLRRGLEKHFLATNDIRCVASLDNLMDVVGELRKVQADVVLMEIDLPDRCGNEGVRTVKNNFPHKQVLVYTVLEDDQKILEAIRAGASGYLLKSTAPVDVLEAIRQLFHGGAPMSPTIARKVITSIQQESAAGTENYGLTTRENEILDSLVDGLQYKEIADRYVVSISTVRTHICHIYNKLHVHSRSQAVARILGAR